MTDQPTDHRAEAEELLTEAASRDRDNHSELAGLVTALIGIGHWLGAIVDELIGTRLLLAQQQSERNEVPPPPVVRRTFAGEPITLTQAQDSYLQWLVKIKDRYDGAS